MSERKKREGMSERLLDLKKKLAVRLYLSGKVKDFEKRAWQIFFFFWSDL